MEQKKIGLLGPEATRWALEASDGDFVSMPVVCTVGSATGKTRWSPGFEWLSKTGTPVTELAWDGMLEGQRDH